MDTINETINALLDEAAEYRQAAEERPDFAETMLETAKSQYMRVVSELDRQIEAAKCIRSAGFEFDPPVKGSSDGVVFDPLESGKPGA